MKKILTILLSWLAFFAAVFAFVFLSGNGHPSEFLRKLRFDEIDTLVFIAPCIIFGLTVDAYNHYITAYKGVVAGLSITFLLFALVCCIGLAMSRDWWVHMRYMYLLFASYVLWDILMIEAVLVKPGYFEEDLVSDYKGHVAEIDSVSAYINQPTLFTIFFVSIYCTCCIKSGKVSTEAIRHFTAGVVSFHLVFSSIAYALTKYFK